MIWDHKSVFGFSHKSGALLVMHFLKKGVRWEDTCSFELANLFGPSSCSLAAGPEYKMNELRSLSRQLCCNESVLVFEGAWLRRILMFCHLNFISLPTFPTGLTLWRLSFCLNVYALNNTCNNHCNNKRLTNTGFFWKRFHVVNSKTTLHCTRKATCIC